MTFADSEALVSTEWLAAHLSDPDLRILDCTWHHASTNLDGRTHYRGRHLPGAVHFDIDHIDDKSNPLPHMLPSPADHVLSSRISPLARVIARLSSAKFPARMERLSPLPNSNSCQRADQTLAQLWDQGGYSWLAAQDGC
jgi:hypothetical protein